MGIESSSGKIDLLPSRTAEDVDRLLELFPEENRPRLEERIEGKSLGEQALLLENALKKRREFISAPRYTSERLPMTAKVSQKVLERFAEEKAHIEVGRGENGRVFELSPADTEAGATSVFKILIRPPQHMQNDLLSEGAFQADVAAFADAYKELRIGVPHPYYIAASGKGYVLAMEKVPGYSIDRLMQGEVQLPENFDFDTVERHLQEFVLAMNEAGFYHRDLREGNIMIDPEATEGHISAYIIDFGFATKADSMKSAYADLDGLQDHVMIKRVMDRLREKQELVRSQGV